jgi:hypothetical protein
VESLPRTTKAADVVAAARKAGLVISQNYVWVLRSGRSAKSKAAASGATKRGPGRPKGSKNKGAAPSTPKASGAETLEVTLRRLVLDYGRNRVRDELAKIEASVARLLTGG